MKKSKSEAHQIWQEYEKGLGFNSQIGLYETVRTNENFFIGKQWEGVEANGLPTPVFNFLKRVVLFTISSITSSNIKLQATTMADAADEQESSRLSDVVNAEFDSLFETNRIGSLIREYMRNAAVDGDACTYTYWDPDVETGHPIKGAVVTEVIENTRVFFGNANDRRVQKQPYIIISRREMADEAKERAEENNGENWDIITPDSDDHTMDSAHITDDKVTVLLKLWRDKKTNTIWGHECTRNAVVRPAWDTGLKLYPVTWLNWDYIQDSYHGMAMISGLIPNQIFINKLFAMSMISLMTTAYPKIVYDKTRIPKWDNRVGAAIPVSGGDVNSVARIIDPAQISPQIAQFIELAINHTQTFLGATNAALGNVRPENTSAIIALQKASAIPNEITKQNLYQSLEDLGRIYLDFMAEYYGTRAIDIDLPESTAKAAEFAGVTPGAKVPCKFDFNKLKGQQVSLKLDVGASSYWSEIAAIQTLDNLMMRGKIDLIDYLERIPDGYITKRQELLDKLKNSRSVQAAGGQPGVSSAGGQAAQLMQMMGAGGGQPTKAAAQPQQQPQTNPAIAQMMQAVSGGNPGQPQQTGQNIPQNPAGNGNNALQSSHLLQLLQSRKPQKTGNTGNKKLAEVMRFAQTGNAKQSVPVRGSITTLQQRLKDLKK